MFWQQFIKRLFHTDLKIHASARVAGIGCFKICFVYLGIQCTYTVFLINGYQSLQKRFLGQIQIKGKM